MFTNYLKIAVRNLMGNKIYSLTNIFGLAISLAACIIIIQYISFEWSFDRFHTRAHSIYRVALDKHQDGERKYRLATNYNAAAVVLKESFPEILETGRLFPTYTVGNCIISAMYNGERIQLAQLLLH